MSNIVHTEACEADYLLWGECIHDADGTRVEGAQVVVYDSRLPEKCLWTVGHHSKDCTCRGRTVTVA